MSVLFDEFFLVSFYSWRVVFALSGIFLGVHILTFTCDYSWAVVLGIGCSLLLYRYYLGTSVAQYFIALFEPHVVVLAIFS